ncbi:cytochrome P450 CYP72A219-like [Mercurialis annua]|uniref:cytochrome P450 CYP72A219-like n=1 Tax=Mercurialis annua TaxID=3986 RepID=UPI00215E1526|nr:cytochrome P450 CYP72A219-like [Mercurialis annua]
MAFLAIVLLLFIQLALFLSLKLVYQIWLKPKITEHKLRKQGIHVQSFKQPHGNIKEANIEPELTHDIGARVDPLLHGLASRYKKLFAVSHGTMPTVIIMDPKLIKEILTRKFDFQKPEVSPTMKFFLKGLANIEGDKWAKHRKIINPAFHIEKLKGMLPSFMASCEEMIEKWDNLIGSAEYYEVDVMPEFQDLTADIISRAAFGSNLEEGKFIFSLQRKQGQLFLQSLFNLNSIWSRLLPSKLTKRMVQIHRQIRSLFEGIIENKEKATHSGNTDQQDLLSLLLQSNSNEVNENKNGGMSREDIIEECKLFYFAGHETTANLLTWTMVMLSMHQNWQDKARNEVLQLVGKKKLTFDDLNHLKIVNMILLEVLRLYPPTSLVRSIHKETKIGEYSLPAGVNLKVPLHLVQRDPQLWGDDATEFNPDRFYDGILKASKDQLSFFSFGWGPRICIGQNFAMLEAKLALALILQRFSFHLSPTYKHAPNVVITLQPKFGAQIILHKI